MNTSGDPHRQAFRDRRVLITGGLGFIGSNLAKQLVDLGARPTLVDSLVPQYGGNLANIQEFKDRVIVNIADVRDPHSMRFLVQNQDFLFSLAGQTSHLDSMRDPFTDMEINCRAQLSILEACRLHNPGISIVFASTRQIYGAPNYLPVDENHPLQPVDVNGINKMAGEAYHILYHRVHGIRTSALRLTNTYGPRMRVKDARQTFLGVWIKQVLLNEPFEVWGGAQKRDLTYVDDAVDALMRAAVDGGAAGRVFNLGGDRAISLRTLAELLVAANGGSGHFDVCAFPDERRRIDVGDYYADDRLIRDTLGWRPSVILEDGLKQTLDFYRTRLDSYL